MGTEPAKGAHRRDKTGEDARARAVHYLVRVEQDRAYVGHVARVADGGAREARQTTDYVAGIVRWRRYLDFLLGAFYKGDLASMEPLLLQIMRLGAYDLLMLQTPAHAALNESVELARRLVRPGAARLVNGVLRSLLRSGDALPAPQTGDRAEDLAIVGSHPTWMVRRWIARYGEEGTQALMAWNNGRPTFGVRVNTLHIHPEALLEELEAGDEVRPSPVLNDFFRTQRLQPFVRSGALRDGRCAVQDESAGLIVRVLAPQAGETVFDACAAPGGKTTYAAIRMGNRGRVWAGDVHEGRLRLVEESARTHGIRIIKTLPGDLRRLPLERLGGPVDRVLLDVPCSGLGVLAKRADLRWNREEADLDELVRLQDTLLDAAAPLVRVGGRLVYSTCTIEPQENQERVAAFLERHPGYAREAFVLDVPPHFRTEAGDLATLPHRDHMDGAYAARLTRLR